MEIKTIGLASDHAGYALKQFVKKYLEEKGFARNKAPEKGISVARFRDNYADINKTYIIQCPRHLTIIHQKNIIDTFDCSDRTVEGYWERK